MPSGIYQRPIGYLPKSSFKKGHQLWLGKKHTEKSIEKNRLAHLGKPNLKLRGRKLSEEHIQKLKDSKKGKHYPKMSLAKTGIKQSPETIEKRVAHFRGVKRPQWVVDKIKAKNKRGKDSHFWRGGVCKLSHRLRECPEYAKWRLSIFQRDKFVCQECGAKGGQGIYIEAHHIIRFVDILKNNNIKTIEEAIGCPKLWDTNNGITLCHDCHLKTDNYGKGLVPLHKEVTCEQERTKTSETDEATSGQ